MSDETPGPGEADTAVVAQQEPEGEEQAFELTVVEGPDAGARIVVEPGRPAPALLGTSSACDLRLGDRQVSRRHARLEPAGRRLRVTDLDSTNGSFVDGVAVVEAFLLGGEVLRLGSTAVAVRRVPGPAQARARASSFGKVLGESAAMRRLYPLLERVAASDVPVVIEGETGTGKEVVAEAVHAAGPRAAGPYVVFDCTAVPPNLVESELFGHERGAFTGAFAARKGVFEQAHRGTLLIDEIGDLDPSLQPKLLRALERSEVRRIGAQQWIQVDVRVLAATRRDLDHEVQAGRFRDDLFHRLTVGRVELPPLRRRRGDVALLARHFWSELGGGTRRLPRQLLLRWEDYSWPGNVRELRNAVARQLSLGDTAPVSPEEDDAAAEAERSATEADGLVTRILSERLPLPMARLALVTEFERLYIAQVLAEHGGNVPKAAEASGIARRYFQLLRTGRRRR
jgi:DNA-binding NtrC family response regulator